MKYAGAKYKKMCLKLRRILKVMADNINSFLIK